MEEMGIINTIKSYQSSITTDENVINKHLEMLVDEPEMRELYQLVSENIHRLHNK